MRLNARVGGATRPSRPGRSLTGRSGGTPNRKPQGIFWPSEYEPEPDPGTVDPDPEDPGTVDPDPEDPGTEPEPDPDPEPEPDPEP